MGNQQWVQHYEPQPAQQNILFEYCWSVIDLDDGGYVLAGEHNWLGPRNINRPMIIRTNSNGVERWRAVYEFDEVEEFGNLENHFNSVIVGHDGSIIAAGSINNLGQRTGQD